MKPAINSALSVIAAIAAVACSQTMADEFDDGGLTVITDNFRVQKAEENNGTEQSIKNENFIGELGENTVVQGEKDPTHLAFVRTNGNSGNYIIKNTIMVKCKKGQDCIPSGVKAVKLSQNIYEVTVQSYDEWKSLQNELKNTEGVISVAPSFEHGIGYSLK